MKYHLKENPQTEVDVEEEIDEQSDLENNLVVYNDDITTFDLMEETLMEVCGHTELQAKQCAIIIHKNGKCSVKKGSIKKLRPMLQAILDRKISAVIE